MLEYPKRIVKQVEYTDEMKVVDPELFILDRIIEDAKIDLGRHLVNMLLEDGAVQITTERNPMYQSEKITLEVRVGVVENPNFGTASIFQGNEKSSFRELVRKKREDVTIRNDNDLIDELLDVFQP